MFLPLLLIFFQASWAANSESAAPPWVLVEKAPSLTIEEWGKQTGFHVFADADSGRILFEKKKSPPLIFLLGQPYALRGERFLYLPDAPFIRGGKILLSGATAERALLPLLEEPERSRLAQAIHDLDTKQGDAPCLLHRPVKRIFLDPGHGGTDIGTKHDKILEKDIVLKLGRLVADQLRRQGFEVSFSRTKDVFLPLEIRSKLAKEWRADVFLSLHVNHSPNADVHGTETYILSQDATDAEARKLALIENSIAGEARAQQGAVLDILWDMEQTAYLQESAYLASYVQGAMVRTLNELLKKQNIPENWKNRGVRQAPFFVLNRAAMPAILVELGYLSNSRDRKWLTQKNFQESLAKGLSEGVKKYKDECRTIQ